MSLEVLGGKPRLKLSVVKLNCKRNRELCVLNLLLQIQSNINILEDDYSGWLHSRGMGHGSEGVGGEVNLSLALN